MRLYTSVGGFGTSKSYTVNCVGEFSMILTFTYLDPDFFASLTVLDLN